MIGIEEWSVVQGGDANTAPEARPRILRGKVYGHPTKKDGTPVRTSNIVLLDLPRRTCLTVKSIYRLGEPHPDYAKQYPESKE